MSCAHKNLRLNGVQIDDRANGSFAFSGTILCKDCDADFVLADTRVSMRSKRFEILLKPTGFNPKNLRCPLCSHRLFGAPSTPGATLDRAEIVEIECGEPHHVHLSDGATLAVGAGSIELIREVTL